jgi:RimJ/RimL family protein N-acetyltransferase
MTTLSIPKPAYRIETKRLVLRCWEPKDAALIQEATAANKEHLLPFMPWAADEPQTIAACSIAAKIMFMAYSIGMNYARWAGQACTRV